MPKRKLTWTDDEEASTSTSASASKRSKADNLQLKLCTGKDGAQSKDSDEEGNLSFDDDDDDDVIDKNYKPPARETSSDSESESESEVTELERRAVSVAKASSAKNIPDDNPKDTLPKGSVIWIYFKKEIQRNKKDEIVGQTAVCQVKVPAVTGKICGVTLKQPMVSTTGPRQHLERKHPAVWAELQAIEKARKNVKAGVKRTARDVYDVVTA